MNESETLTARVKEIKEKISGYYTHQEIQTQIASLSSNLSRYLKELKTYYWRSKVLTKIFKEEITGDHEEAQRIFTERDLLLQGLATQVDTRTLSSANEKIAGEIETLSDINERFSAKILERKKELENVIHAKASLTKIRDLQGFSTLRPEDLQYYKDKISSRFYSPVLEDSVGEFKEFYPIWAGFEKRMSKVMSLDMLKVKYGMTQESVNIIQKLVSGEKVDLSSLNTEVLGDLKKLSDFCTTVSLRIER